jgi:type IV secretion system protein VirB1
MKLLAVTTSLTLLALGALASTPAVAAISANVLELAKQCAPNVHPLTMAYLVAHESNNNRLAINVNGNYHLPKQPQSETEAASMIRSLEARGKNFDVGYAQINSANFERLGMRGEDLLAPCNDLRASASVLTGCYAQAVRTLGEGQSALRHALSCYNTGSQTRGFTNGYVSAMVAQARLLQIPALLDDVGTAASSERLRPDAAYRSHDDSGKNPDTSLASAPSARRGSDAGAFSVQDAGAFGSTKPEAP